MIAEFPSVSVIMPIRNEESFIEKSLGAVFSQNYPHSCMEILIADGMSTDNTRNLIAMVSENCDIPVKILDNPKRIVPTGMNAAIRCAKGEVIVRVDGHAILEPDYIRKCIACLIDTGAHCVGGVIVSEGIGFVGKAIAEAMSSRFGVGGSGFRTISAKLGPLPTDTVPFGAFKRDVFDTVGFFNEKMVRHQDYELNYRLRKSGGKILLNPSAKATYFVRSTIAKLCKQYWQYGVWKGRFLRAHPDSVKFRHLIPPSFVCVLLISCILAVFSDIGAMTLKMALSAYSVLIASALISFSLRKKIKYIIILPAILIVMHINWGVGIWYGVFSPVVKKEPA